MTLDLGKEFKIVSFKMPYSPSTLTLIERLMEVKRLSDRAKFTIGKEIMIPNFEKPCKLQKFYFNNDNELCFEASLEKKIISEKLSNKAVVPKEKYEITGSETNND